MARKQKSKLLSDSSVFLRKKRIRRNRRLLWRQKNFRARVLKGEFLVNGEVVNYRNISRVDFDIEALPAKTKP